MSAGKVLSSVGLSVAATIVLALPGQVQASSENYQYLMKSSADALSIRPTEVRDDGKATWFVIPSDSNSRPEIFIVTPDGKEKLAERYVYAPNADNTSITFIAFDVAGEWRIRKGKMVVAVKNENFKKTVTVTDGQKNISQAQNEIQDDIENYLIRLNSVSNQVRIKVQSININPRDNSADFSYARFIKTTRNHAPYTNYEKVHGSLTYSYIDQPKENEGPKPKPLFQVQSINFKTVGDNNESLQ